MSQPLHSTTNAKRADSAATGPVPMADLRQKLTQFGQAHLVPVLESAPAEQAQRLARQIAGLDLAELAQLSRQTAAKTDWALLAVASSGPACYKLRADNNPICRQVAMEEGQSCLTKGCCGLLLVAGGQGTRLGFDHPKGMYDIGPVSRASLFQILFEKVLATCRRYGQPFPIYLMTSPATDQETRDYLAHKNWFGLPEGDVHIFCQGTMPAVEIETGKLLLSGPAELAQSPDGHGGLLPALASSGGLADMKARGLTDLSYIQIDNPLVLAADPEFLGYHLLSGSEMSTQVARKNHPLQKVGNVVAQDGSLYIIEYSDLPEDQARRLNEDGSLRFWAGNLAVHLFKLSFLERMAQDAASLPFHLAHKKVPFWAAGKMVEPSQPNAIKFERFIFDLLPQAQAAIVVEVDPEVCFAPLKNGPDSVSDSPQSVQAQMLRLHRGWLEQAGAWVGKDVPVEIGPLFALDAAEVAQKISAGRRFEQPTFLAE